MRRNSKRGARRLLAPGAIVAAGATAYGAVPAYGADAPTGTGRDTRVRAAAPAGPAGWRLVPDATPGSGHAVWMDVAALGPRDAWAVGLAREADIYGGIAAHWNGRAWTRVPVPGEGEGHEVTSLSALAPDDVWAAGRQWQGRTWRWDGTAWSAVPVPGQPDPDQGSHTTRFEDVAALSPRNAWAVGERRNELIAPTLVRPEVIHWNGRAWKRVTPPRVGRQSRLTALAPVSAANVWAVGHSTDHRTGVRTAFLARWNGYTWKVVAAPALPRDSVLTGVTAISATDVWAVGSAAGRPLALHWDGTRWRAVPTPRITGVLADVAPDGRGGLWAAGGPSVSPFEYGTTFFLHWDGTRWTRVADPAGTGGGLYGLGRVPGGATVWAVGTDADPGTGRIEVNGRLP